MTTHPVSPSIMAEMEKRLAEPRPCPASGWTPGGYSEPVWTPAGFLRRGQRYVLACSCGHRAEAPLQRLVEAGEGDMPMHTFTSRWRCEKCRGQEITIILDELPDGVRVAGKV